MLRILPAVIAGNVTVTITIGVIDLSSSDQSGLNFFMGWL